MSEHRSLLMRANRLLGASLVEHNLVKIEDLEAANERMLELSSGGAERQCTILGILVYEKKVLTEEAVLNHIVENEGVGLIDLRNYEVPEDVRKSLDLGACWATWTVPFDLEEDFHFVATAHYLSSAVRTFWEKRLKGSIIWHATTLEMIADFLEKAEAGQAGAAGPAAAAKP